jgi:hypothetical protein
MMFAYTYAKEIPPEDFDKYTWQDFDKRNDLYTLHILEHYRVMHNILNTNLPYVNVIGKTIDDNDGWYSSSWMIMLTMGVFYGISSLDHKMYLKNVADLYALVNQLKLLEGLAEI